MAAGADEGKRLSAGEEGALVHEFELFHQFLPAAARGDVPGDNNKRADYQASADQFEILAEIASAQNPEQ